MSYHFVAAIVRMIAAYATGKNPKIVTECSEHRRMLRNYGVNCVFYFV